MKTPQLIDSSKIKDSPIPGFLQPERWLPIIAVFALLAACTTPDPLDKLAREHQLLRGLIQAGDFKLVTLSKPLPTNIPQLRVYIGSDGRPWFKNQPTGDPTGTRALAAELMLQDPLPALYLGRPCYHINLGNPPCEEALWTSGRYSHAVIEAMTQALQEIVRNHTVKQLTLVGYSGGGVVALLVASRLTAARLTAARRNPALNLTVITVAANLDIEAWTQFHQHLPLTDSLNPAEEIPSPAGFRQIHLLGRDDQVVPADTASRYLERHPDAKLWYLDEFDHRCCWVQQWPALLGTMDDPG